MPLIESVPQGKKTWIKFQADSATRELLTFYCEFSQNKKFDPVIVGALKMLFKADSDFGPWVEQKKRQLASQPPDSVKPKPTTSKTETTEGKRTA